MQDFIRGALFVCLYFLIAASSLLLCRRFFTIPDEPFRKALHFVLLFSYFPFVFGFRVYWHAVLFALALAVLIYPLLALAERIPGFSAFVTERKKGELKHSLLLAFGMIAFSNLLCRGLFHDPWLVLICVYAWGIGDAFAALVGKKYGKHKIRWKKADPKKSYEGSLAMLLSSSLGVFLLLRLQGSLEVLPCVLVAFLGSLSATVTELVSPNGNDTLYCPLAAMAVILPLMLVLGGIGL